MVKSVIASIAALALASSVRAGGPNWDGQAIGIAYYYPNLGTLSLDTFAYVGSGVEANYNGIFDIDLSATQVVLDFKQAGSWTAASFNGLGLYEWFIGYSPDLLGVSINGSTTMAGLDGSRLSWDANQIYLNMQSLDYQIGTQVVLDLQFEVLPEPNSWVAGGLLAAAAGVVWVRWRCAQPSGVSGDSIARG